MRKGYIARRIAEVIPTVLGIVLIAFLLIHVAPGDPVTALAGEHGDAAYYAFMRHRFGLDQSLPHQLLTFFGRIISGDLGYSYVQGRRTILIIAERIPATALLGGAALLIALVVSIPLGVLTASRPDGPRDTTINTIALSLFSAPTFWLGQLAILALALGLGFFPVQGMTTAGSDAIGTRHVFDIARHLTLPAITLAAPELAILMRLSRNSLLHERTRDHIRTARAKGVGEFWVLVRHAFPRALLPVVTVVGTRFGHVLVGAAVVEVVFGWPGMGRLLLTALETRDTPLLLGLFLVVSFSVVIVNLLTDVLHATLDPRIRVG